MKGFMRVIVGIALAASAQPAAGQLVRGRVLDDKTDRPLATATVTLMDVDGKAVSTYHTDSTGWFIFRAPRRAEYRMRAQMLGYTSATSPKVRIGPADSLDVELRLLVDAVLLAPLTVTASARPWHELMKPPGVWAFYERKAHMERLGLGDFVTREMIDAYMGGTVSTILGTMPGVTTTNGSVTFRRAIGAGNGECMPAIFLNGAPVNLADLTLDQFIDLPSLEGIEVYRGPSQLPAEYSGSSSQCGAVALWTRRGG